MQRTVGDRVGVGAPRNQQKRAPTPLCYGDWREARTTNRFRPGLWPALIEARQPDRV